MGAVLVIVLMVLFPGCGEPSEDDPDPLELDFGQVFPRDSGTEWIYDGYVTIRNVNMDKPPRWEDLRVVVQNVDEGDLYPTIVTLIEPTHLIRETTGTINASRVYYYQKPGHETDRVEPLAGIMITGMDLSFEGAEIYVTLGEKTLGMCRIPSEFPVPSVYLTLSIVTVTTLDVSPGSTSPCGPQTVKRASSGPGYGSAWTLRPEGPTTGPPTGRTSKVGTTPPMDPPSSTRGM